MQNYLTALQRQVRQMIGAGTTLQQAAAAAAAGRLGDGDWALREDFDARNVTTHLPRTGMGMILAGSREMTQPARWE